MDARDSSSRSLFGEGYSSFLACRTLWGAPEVPGRGTRGYDSFPELRELLKARFLHSSIVCPTFLQYLHTMEVSRGVIGVGIARAAWL